MKKVKKCSHKVGRIKGMILVSKYMIKKYGFQEALERTLMRKNPRMIL